MKLSFNLVILAAALTEALPAPRRLQAREFDNEVLEARTNPYDYPLPPAGNTPYHWPVLPPDTPDLHSSPYRSVQSTPQQSLPFGGQVGLHGTVVPHAVAPVIPNHSQSDTGLLSPLSIPSSHIAAVPSPFSPFSQVPQYFSPSVPPAVHSALQTPSVHHARPSPGPTPYGPDFFPGQMQHPGLSPGQQHLSPSVRSTLRSPGGARSTPYSSALHGGFSPSFHPPSSAHLGIAPLPIHGGHSSALGLYPDEHHSMHSSAFNPQSHSKGVVDTPFGIAGSLPPGPGPHPVENRYRGSWFGKGEERAINHHPDVHNPKSGRIMQKALHVLANQQHAHPDGVTSLRRSSPEAIQSGDNTIYVHKGGNLAFIHGHKVVGQYEGTMYHHSGRANVFEWQGRQRNELVVHQYEPDEKALIKKFTFTEHEHKEEVFSRPANWYTAKAV